MKAKIWNFLKNHEWPIVWLVSVAALILGILGFTKYFAVHGLKRTEWDVFYLALQLFTLESGFQQKNLPLILDFARFLAPAVTVYTAAKALTVIFRRQLQLVRLQTMRDHVVIAGLGRSGMLFTEAFRKEGQSVVVVEQNEDNEQMEHGRDLGALTLIGDARSPEILSKARVEQARVLICVGGSDGVNAEIAVQARELIKDVRKPLTSLVHIVDSQLCRLLRKQELMTGKNESLRVEFFNIYESAVRDLLARHAPLEPAQKPHFLIVGLGQMGESLLLALARLWMQETAKTSPRFAVTILDRAAIRKVEALSIRFPYLVNNCSITPHEIEVPSSEFYQKVFLKTPALNRVYVCLDNDSLVLSTALLLRQWLPAETPVYVRMSHQGGLATLLRASGKSNLIPFGAMERICTPDLLSGGMKEILGRAIHDEYVTKQRDQSALPAPNDPALCSWEELPEWLKESNRTQADHIGEKLRMVHCDVISYSDEDAENFQFEDKEIEALARMEHERWVEERKKDNWKYAAGEKNTGNKTSPYLVPYDQLSEQVKEYNRTTVRELPRFLARAGYQIYRI